MSLKLSSKKVALLTVIIAASLIISISGAYALNELSNPADDEPISDLKRKVVAEEVTITSIDNSTVTILRESGEQMNLSAKGRWVVISDEARVPPWTEAKDYVKEGTAQAIILAGNLENETEGMLLGLRQGEVTIFRPMLAKACARKHKHTSIYLSFRGEVEKIGENYMILRRGDQKILASTRGSWIKAGGGEVEWKDVSSEFNQGDQVRLFYHNLVIMNNFFAENLGIRGFIWGYSGAIIDLTSGTTLSRK
ncbi:MAG: hypothetical protein DRN54_03130 [Thaumarchaeota archaeon]|nr:MAG: hypothetical protein DRN54_03130 [Nitrososphaerota archaeon]